MNGTWHDLFCSEIIIKRQHNIIRIAGLVRQSTPARKMYFLIGYSEELLSNWLQCPVKLELQTIEKREQTYFKFIWIFSFPCELVLVKKYKRKVLSTVNVKQFIIQRNVYYALYLSFFFKIISLSNNREEWHLFLVRHQTENGRIQRFVIFKKDELKKEDRWEQ